MTDATDSPPPPSVRTTVKRGADRARYGTEDVTEILDSGIVAHVGVATDDGPIVLPMAYGHADGELFLHGSVANAMLRAGRAVDVCVTITLLDGLVIARTPFHNSMNYRSVVVRGTAELVDDSDKAAALKVINDHVVPIWDTAREPSELDYRKTMVLRMPLTEASAKVRAGDPIDEDIDMDGPHWAGVVPIESTFGAPVSAADLRGAIDAPDAVAGLEGRDPFG